MEFGTATFTIPSSTFQIDPLLNWDDGVLQFAGMAMEGSQCNSGAVSPSGESSAVNSASGTPMGSPRGFQGEFSSLAVESPLAPRRGRRSLNWPMTQMSAEEQSKARRSRKLECNRRNAKLARERKKHMILILQQSVIEMQNMVQNLARARDELVQENARLKALSKMQ